MIASSVSQEMATSCASAYVPPAGLNTGEAAMSFHAAVIVVSAVMRMISPGSLVSGSAVPIATDQALKLLSSSV